MTVKCLRAAGFTSGSQQHLLAAFFYIKGLEKDVLKYYILPELCNLQLLPALPVQPTNATNNWLC